jgi:cellulose biosynthesis protein BcsQ
MIRERYAIWNNKGGVGKSTLTFHLATHYASTHPDEQVLVVDMCPQANSTMMLLGSGDEGESRLIELETRDPAPTIAGYIAERIKSGTNPPGAIDAGLWCHQVSKINANLPSNLHLVPGDGNLELLAAPISYYANAQFPAAAWAAVHMWVRELTDAITKGDGKWTVFIDSNPSFAIYTELAMIAADKLLIPFNADDSSRHAVSAIVRLLYGVGKANPVFDKFTFRQLTHNAKLQAPFCHLFIGNRFTQYKGSAKAYSALSAAVGEELFSIYRKTPALFTPRKAQAGSLKDFLSQYTVDVRDFNTAGVVAAHMGVLLSSLKNGSYDVHGQAIEVVKDRVKECVDSVAAVCTLI